MNIKKSRLDGECERLYYLCDSRTIVGNCLQFWAKNGKGYTYDLDRAHVYTEEEALKMHKSRPSDVPYPKDIVDQFAKRHIDHQFLDAYESTYKAKINEES